MFFKNPIASNSQKKMPTYRSIGTLRSPIFHAHTKCPILHNTNRVRCFASQKMSLPRVYFDMTADGAELGRIVMELRSDVVPKTGKTNHGCIEKKNQI